MSMEKPRIDELAKLMSEKQKAFCDHYITTLNATEAAKMAGYSKKTATVIGCENLTKPYIERIHRFTSCRIGRK